VTATDEPIDATSVGRAVSWLELFYDLVFVAAVVTFSDAISFDPGIGRIGAVDAAFGAMWLIWLATTLHANRYRDDGGVHRALVLVQMLLLTVNALAVGDGFDAHPQLICLTYALLAFDVAVMYARVARSHDDAGRLAARRRNQYFAAAVPILASAFVPETWRIGLWCVGTALLAWPTIGFRFGRAGADTQFDEHHFVERLGLLTIIVCGESFVKVSLLAADGTLDGIDLEVLVTMFVFMFGVWWSYFDDVPSAGIRNTPSRSAGWLVGHLMVQLALVASAVGYDKVLGYEFGTTLSGDTSLLLTIPLVAVLLGLALIGVCSRRVPQRGLVTLRLGVAALVAFGAVLTWQTGWISADVGAIVLALTALGQAGVSDRLRRHTRVEPRAELRAPP
jgi:low temperature requirement protein LtrA